MAADRPLAKRRGAGVGAPRRGECASGEDRVRDDLKNTTGAARGPLRGAGVARILAAQLSVRATPPPFVPPCGRSSTHSPSSSAQLAAPLTASLVCGASQEQAQGASWIPSDDVGAADATATRSSSKCPQSASPLRPVRHAQRCRQRRRQRRDDAPRRDPTVHALQSKLRAQYTSRWPYHASRASRGGENVRSLYPRLVGALFAHSSLRGGKDVYGVVQWLADGRY